MFYKFTDQLFSPVFVIFLLVLFGNLLGRIKIFGVRIGTAGVLWCALIYGAITQAFSAISLLPVENIKSAYSHTTSLGMALFISAISFSAGGQMTDKKIGYRSKVFFGGMSVVLIGGLCAAIFLLLDFTKSDQLMFGIFSGSMTSTPTLAMSHELFDGSSEVTAGYGMSYCFGLMTIIIFVQIMCKKSSKSDGREKNKENNHFTMPDIKQMIALSLTVVCGYIIGNLTFVGISLGTTAGMLISGLIIGSLFKKKSNCLPDVTSIRNFGLVLFFVGAGIPAGSDIVSFFSLKGLLLGALIAASSVMIGYLVLRHLFHFSVCESLTVLCGGMTSTPAIVILKEQNNDADMSLYTTSYIGALIGLILSVKIMFFLVEGRC